MTSNLTAPNLSDVITVNHIITYDIKIASFIEKMIEMMNSPENYYNVDYKTTAKLIEWSNEGKSITIYKPQIFERTLLPIFYKHVNRFSFIRQLNSHGFTKITFYQPQAQKQQSSAIGNSLIRISSPPPIKLDYFSPEGLEVRENKRLIYYNNYRAAL